MDSCYWAINMIPDTGPVIRIPDTVPFIWIPDNGSLIGTHDTDPLIGIPDNGSLLGILLMAP